MFGCHPGVEQALPAVSDTAGLGGGWEAMVWAIGEGGSSSESLKMAPKQDLKSKFREGE